MHVFIALSNGYYQDIKFIMSYVFHLIMYFFLELPSARS